MAKYSLITGIISLFFLWTACQDNAGTGAKDKGSTAVDTSFYFPLGGVSQHVEIWGKSRKNPVLLFIHGGPGLSALPYLRYYNPALAEHYTIATYDQRGAWVSSNVVERPGNMTLEQHISDAAELTDLLQKEFGQSKIYLAGHDWGSVIGLMMAQRFPEDYHAYCGMGQIIHTRKSLQEANRFLNEKAVAFSDGDVLHNLRILTKDTAQVFLGKQMGFMKQKMWLHKYRGLEWDTAIHQPILADPLALYNRNALNVSLQNTLQELYQDFLQVNLEGITELKIPLYLFQGEHDCYTSLARNKAFFDRLSAPEKKLFIFEKSGHSPQWEEPAYFIDNMKNHVRSRF